MEDETIEGEIYFERICKQYSLQVEACYAGNGIYFIEKMDGIIFTQGIEAYICWGK